MGRPRTKLVSLKERLEAIRVAGLNAPALKKQESSPDDEPLKPLSARLPQILNILKGRPAHATHMHCMILYDIENNKVRREVARYLLRQGCVRIQKSVYLASLKPEAYKGIFETLKEVQEYYDNVDSILLVPINSSDARAMKIIGKDIQVETIIDKPNSLFF